MRTLFPHRYPEPEPEERGTCPTCKPPFDMHEPWIYRGLRNVEPTTPCPTTPSSEDVLSEPENATSSDNTNEDDDETNNTETDDKTGSEPETWWVTVDNTTYLARKKFYGRLRDHAIANSLSFSATRDKGVKPNPDIADVIHHMQRDAMELGRAAVILRPPRTTTEHERKLEEAIDCFLSRPRSEQIQSTGRIFA